MAARAHVEALEPLIAGALADAGVTIHDVDAVAATAGPGLIGGVMVGLVTGKALAHAASKPFVAVNHLEGHALSPRLTDADLAFPYLLLLVSGGHCQLLLVEGVAHRRPRHHDRRRRGRGGIDNREDSWASASPAARRWKRPQRWAIPPPSPCPRPLKGSAKPHFSFAGLKAAVMRAAPHHDPADVAASFQAAVVDCLVDRTRKALHASRGATASVVAGGVAANGAVRAALRSLAAATHDLRFVAPPLWLCTDNAAMIAWAGAERFAGGHVDPLDTPARARWPRSAAEAVRGAGVKA
ncbi:tRNA (adenosine(37)-N6)-threonylcarbamoyltransferase complex transferase subunit TsaD [Sphingomonas sp. MMS24-JH45]